MIPSPSQARRARWKERQAWMREHPAPPAPTVTLPPPPPPRYAWPWQRLWWCRRVATWLRYLASILDGCKTSSDAVLHDVHDTLAQVSQRVKELQKTL